MCSDDHEVAVIVCLTIFGVFIVICGSLLISSLFGEEKTDYKYCLNKCYLSSQRDYNIQCIKTCALYNNQCNIELNKTEYNETNRTNRRDT